MTTKCSATDSGAPSKETPKKEHERSDSEKSLANANLDQMSDQEMRSELQRLGIQTCESTPQEFLQPLLKLAMELKTNTPNANYPTTPKDEGCEAFFCSICIDEYSPTELAKIPRNLECGHSFCTACLIQSRSQHYDKCSITYGIKCPTCRSLTLAPTRDDVSALPKNFTAIAMLQSTKRQSIEAKSTVSKRRRFDSTDALANAVRMCELLEGRPNVEKNPAKAFQMAEEGSQAGCIHSMGILGRCYFTGAGVGVDTHRGLKLGRDSAVAGSAYGEFVVALAYEQGSGGVEKDLQESAEHYKVAVEYGIAEAQYFLADLFLTTRFTQPNIPFFGDKTLTWDVNYAKATAEALKLLRLASEQGHADSQILLGIRLWVGFDGGKYSLLNNEAFSALKEGVKQGSARRHLQGLNEIARCYSRSGDHVEEFNYYKLASDQGHLDSTFQLARMHKDGQGVEKNVQVAVDIYKRLIENGDITMRRKSIKAIRDLYLEVEDNAEALQWCKRGADEEITLSFVHQLARMLEGWDPRYPNYEKLEHFYLNVPLKGDGIERDFGEAAKYYKLACEIFSDDEVVADSAYELAKMHEVR
jgi:TPR repeat protein